LRNLIIGDVHGHFKNLRRLLIEQGAINEDNERINQDTLKVYCTGDLIDGGVNRMGDFLILDYIEEWFDEVVIGNHEYPFMGGPAFVGLRSHDRQLQLRLLELEEKGVYVPSIAIGDTLLTHAGLSSRWSFKTAQDANDAIRAIWDNAIETTDDVPILDWVGPGRSKFGNDVGGVFWLDWSEPRNLNINQVVGHTSFIEGPIVTRYAKNTIEHWNVDAAGKFGLGLGGIIIEEGQPTIPVFSGIRYVPKEEKFIYYSKEKKEWDGWKDEIDWEEIDSLDDEENLAKYRELMES
jgi:hypothetical protein